jgi:TolB-like protein
VATDLVIILSSDWVGSTRTRAELGEDTADAVQEVHDTLLRRVVTADGGKVVKHYGDGVMATFNSATAALRAAAKIQADFAAYRESPDALTQMEVRVGLAAGDVSHQSGDIFGLPVVEAVRLQGEAAPNEILCSDLVRVLSQGRGGFVFEDAGVRELKGLPAPVRAFRVRRPEGTTQSRPEGARAIAAVAQPARKRSSLLPIAAVLVLAAGIAGWVVLRPASDLSATAAPVVDTTGPAAAAPATTDAPVTLAVLPFANLGGDPEQEYFSDGLTEELLNALAQVRDLRVTGRTSSFSYKGRNEDLRVIASELGVANLLEGSVRRDGNTLRITAQLIDGRDGAHLWSGTYDRELRDVLSVQTEIAQDVAQRLSIRLDVGELARSRGGTANLDAYDAYLRAMQLRPLSGAENLRQRRVLLRSATELDPDFAAAWYDLDVALLGLVSLVPDMSVQARDEHAAILARIDSLPPDAWQTHALRSVLLRSQLRWAEAEAEALIAWRTAPRAMLGTNNFYFDLLNDLGRDVVELTEQAQRSDPNSLNASVYLQMVYAVRGRFAEAAREYERSKALSGDHRFADSMAVIHQRWHPESRTGDGRQRLRQLYFTTPEAVPGQRELEVLTIDDPERALAEVRERVSEPPESWLANFVIIADWLGDADLALQALSSLVSPPRNDLRQLWLPSHSGFRSKPEFEQLLRDLKIADYYRATGNWGEYCEPVGSEDFRCR